MSAITASAHALGPDRIRRYRTKIMVRIDSHSSPNPLFISDDVVSASSGKTIKGAGQMTLLVLPGRNYMNLIRPNDYINVYFNIGDGEGWTRTFFGMVDKIEETYAVNSTGAPQTSYSIVCTDFFKVFQNTQFYNNPHLANRRDVAAAAFGMPNIGGLALMSKGIRVFGSPPDILVNLMLLLLGFGTQFTLPSSYPTRHMDIHRARRAQFIQNRLAQSARDAIENAGGFAKLLNVIQAQESNALSSTVANSGASPSDIVNDLFTQHNITDALDRQRLLHSAQENDVAAMSAILADHRVRNLITAADPDRVVDQDRSAVDMLRTTLPNAQASLLDVLDLFSFVERTAIDGYATEAPVWQQQGPIISLMRSLSHELMNELIIDLRPVVDGENGQFENGFYSRAPDELEGNVDPGGDVNGIMHVPAVVLREYPYSTIDGVDLRGVRLATLDTQSDIGVLYFGEIFASEPDRPGRHAVQIPNINVQDVVDGRAANLALKHLDVAVVHEDEIIRTQLGRSDHEHFNLVEFYSDSLLGSDQRFYMHDLSPLLTPVHVMQHGLRVRSLTTRFARFPPSITANLQPTEDEGIEEQAEAEEAAEAAGPVGEPPVTNAADLGPPVLPGGARFWNGGQGRWGYRKKPNIGPNGSWVMHQGIDILPLPGVQGTAAAFEVPVFAIADGNVVASFPDGCFGGYGNGVVIEHDFSGTRIYSVYMHLSRRAVGPDLDVLTATRRDRRRFCGQGFAGGRSADFPIRIRKGDLVGRMGNTGFSVRGSNPYARTHLHFELDRVFPPGKDTGVGSTPRYHWVTPPASWSAAGTGHSWSDTIVAASAERPQPPAGFDRSYDPMVFYANSGAGDLQDLINSGSTDTTDTDSSEPEDFAHGPRDDADGQRPRETVLQEAGATTEDTPTSNTSTRGVVDSGVTRHQLIRWALLHDHWYQHNLEYLSGRIDMRGAPEIRVGYRVDIPERHMSFYVEGVNHQWKFPNSMTTSLQVTRGQRNDPYPAYVLPPLDPFNPTDTQRQSTTGRLAQYFIVPDPVAVRRSLVLRQAGNGAVTTPTASLGGGADADTINIIDSGYMASTYNEALVLAGGVDPKSVNDIDAEVGAGRVRISGDLRGELAIMALNYQILQQFGYEDFVRFGFEDLAGEDLAQDASATESGAGVAGQDISSSLAADLSIDDYEELISDLRYFSVEDEL